MGKTVALQWWSVLLLLSLKVSRIATRGASENKMKIFRVEEKNVKILPSS